MELNNNYRCMHKPSGDIFERFEVELQEDFEGDNLIIISFSVRGVTTEGEFKVYSGINSDFYFERRNDNA